MTTSYQSNTLTTAAIALGAVALGKYLWRKWNEYDLHGKTVLVTGGAGFLGSHLCTELRRREAAAGIHAGMMGRLWDGERFRFVTDVLGVGGFGIVYKGRGIYFDELVAIKEYFPSAISDRVDGDAALVLLEPLAASLAVPTPASTMIGTLAFSTISIRFHLFWMPRPEPIGAASGITATQPISSRRLARIGSSLV